MGLEAANFIAGLDETWPTGLDPLNKGDDHLRLVKSVLKGQFPGVGGEGYAEAIIAVEDDLNATFGATGNFQDQIDAIVEAAIANTQGIAPVGGIIMYNGLVAGIADNWQLCDGTNGTPDMTDSFVMGTNTEGDILAAGGSNDAVAISHQHDSVPNHTHGITDLGHNHSMNNNYIGNDAEGGNGDNVSTPNTAVTGSKITGISVNSAGGHQHNSAGVDGTDLNRPAFVKLAYIQRMS